MGKGDWNIWKLKTPTQEKAELKQQQKQQQKIKTRTKMKGDGRNIHNKLKFTYSLT